MLMHLFPSPHSLTLSLLLRTSLSSSQFFCTTRAMKSSDIESLAQMLDTNTGFTRPDTQVTGYSQQLSEEDRARAERSTGLVVDHGPGSADAAAQGPGAFPLPSTVVDAQLNLPLPSQSKKALARKAAAEREEKPRGNEIWTQAELARAYQANGGGRAAFGAAAAASPVGTTAAAVSTAPAAGQTEPPHSVLFEHKITAEDVYLQLGGPSGEGGEQGVVVKVDLPDVEDPSSIQLRVEPYHLYVNAGKYFLDALLPREVVKGEASAKWDATKKQLHVRLSMVANIE
ncbi:hypothetical protein STCU_04942 [Strigomonas culicis]|uniref:PIH1D1/2/3 CS-like domain-containing protein n=1 Tax=Strigomonas culicis TaxID=28005 RepID=S9VYD4_9TRYP|nr:hypothetical protein STCU_04942 [Strigomonas culicis]|eukprot:EPY28665.1 hypothetical protein STCU_04942 [Strigomonas culicis]